MTEVTVGGVVVAIVNAIREIKVKNYEPLMWVVVAGVVGSLAGGFGLGDFTHIGYVAGAFAGVAASGGYTLLTKTAERMSVAGK